MALFGSNGVRGVINRDLTPEVALQLGRAVGHTISGTVAFATDTRDSARTIGSAVRAGLMSEGTDVVDLGLIPTPALQHYVATHDDISGGVMITASHNTREYNGLKLIMSDGVEATQGDEQSLEASFLRDIPMETPENVGVIRDGIGAVDEYVDAILSHVDVELIRAAKLKVCVDCAGGAASMSTPLLLRRLGVETVTIGSNPLGAPPRESDPKFENLSDLIAITPLIHADLGVAHDIDGGRAVFVDEVGNFISGDRAGALVAKDILSEHGGKVIASVSSSKALEDVVLANGGLVKYTEVGSHEIVRKLIENLAILGVEEHGGMIIPQMQPCRDGGMALAKMLEIIAKNGPLSKQMVDIPSYCMVKRRVKCPDGMKVPVLNLFAGETLEEGMRSDTTDGIKVIGEDGWILLRPSTTEPFFRIYSEATDEAVAKARADSAVVRIESFLSRSD